MDKAKVIAVGSRRARLWRGLPGLALVLGLALTGLAYNLRVAVQDERVRSYFDFRVREVLHRIGERMGTYQQVLRGAAGLFEATGRVSREQFRTYAERLQLAEHYPGIQGIGYAVSVLPQERAAHLAAIRQEGFPAYTVYPDGERERYAAIVYIEPFAGRNLRAFGYDMYSEATRRKALQLAMDSGQMTLTGKVRLLQETGTQEQAGFLVYQPVYRTDRPNTTAEQRRANIIGWVYEPFRMDDFMYGLFGEYENDLNIEIYGGDTPDRQALMHSDEAKPQSRLSNLSAYESVQKLDMMGHRWTVRINATPSMLGRVDNLTPGMIGAGGTLLSLLLSALFWLLVTSRERALQTAMHMNEELLHERARLNAIIDGTRVGTWEWNVQTGATAFNSEWARIIGYSLEELGPITIDTWLKFAHPDDLQHSEEKLQQHFSGASPHYECEARMKHKLGHWVWVLDRGKVASWTADGKPLMMYGTHQDITQRKQQEESFRHDAQHDALTDLPNRVLLGDRLGRALLAAQRNKEWLALLYMDLDGFKAVNDAYGHEAGDLVLCTTARRIQGCIRVSDTLARVGGDEFVALLPDIGDETNVLALATKILDETSRPVALNPQTSVQISMSIGIALYPRHGVDAHTLLEHADAAMYRAKKGGKNAALVFDEKWPEPVARTVPSALN